MAWPSTTPRIEIIPLDVPWPTSSVECEGVFAGRDRQLTDLIAGGREASPYGAYGPNKSITMAHFLASNVVYLTLLLTHAPSKLDALSAVKCWAIAVAFVSSGGRFVAARAESTSLPAAQRWQKCGADRGDLPSGERGKPTFELLHFEPHWPRSARIFMHIQLPSSRPQRGIGIPWPPSVTSAPPPVEMLAAAIDSLELQHGCRLVRRAAQHGKRPRRGCSPCEPKRPRMPPRDRHSRIGPRAGRRPRRSRSPFEATAAARRSSSDSSTYRASGIASLKLSRCSRPWPMPQPSCSKHNGRVFSSGTDRITSSWADRRWVLKAANSAFPTMPASSAR